MILDPERWRPPVAIAHRGRRVLWPENTDTSFQGVYDLGYRHFETDLHLTADGAVVCLHDPTVDRTTNGSGLVEELTLTQLQELDPGFRHVTPEGFPYRSGGSRIPTLDWLLATYPDVSVVADLKCDAVVGPLVAIIDDLGAHDRVIVGSFSDARLDEFRHLSDRRVATSTGSTSSRLWVLASRVGRGVQGEAAALQLPVRMRGVRVIDEKLVAAAHAAGLQVHAWTVNQPEEMRRLLDFGVDGVITDRPDLLKEVLIERGEWKQ
jgi:glycerophosphoryl diester phosphodiesterase